MRPMPHPMSSTPSVGLSSPSSTKWPRNSSPVATKSPGPTKLSRRGGTSGTWRPRTRSAASSALSRSEVRARASTPRSIAQARGSASPPARLALLCERADPLAEVLRAEARGAQLDQLGLLLGREAGKRRERLDRALVAARCERGVGGDPARQLDRGGVDLGGGDDLVDEPDPLGPRGLDVAPDQEQLLCARDADHVDEPPQPSVAVDQAEPRRRHAELRGVGRYPQVAAHGQLEPAAEAVAVDRGEDRERVRAHRLHCGLEGVRYQRLGVALKALLGDVADVVAGREHLAGARDDHAAHRDPVVELGEDGRERVEDVVIERVSLRRVVEPQTGDGVSRAIEQKLAAGELLGAHRSTYSRTTSTSPSETD